MLFIFSCLSQQINANTFPQADKIDKYLVENIHRGVSGSILVAQGNTILIDKGYGFADRDAKVINSSETVFDIGSLTKQFTAAAILKLAEEGRLRLSDRLDVYFSNLPNDKKQITLHHLLTHSAGFQEYPGRDFDPVSKETYVNTVFSSDLEFTPGARYQYSNVGYSILSQVIEQVTNIDYEAFLSQTFFKPLQMRYTGYIPKDINNMVFAHGYYEDFYDRGTSIEKYNKSGVSPILRGNGGLHSTTGDLYKWLLALKNYEILNEKSVRLLTTKHIETPVQVDAFQSTTYYAYGWKVGSSKYAGKVVSHNGNNGMFRSSMIWRPDNHTFIIYLANTESKGTLWLAYEIDKMLSIPDYLPSPVAPNPYRVIDEYVKKTTLVSDTQLLSYYKEMVGDTITNPTVLNRLASIYFRFNEHTDWALELYKLNVQLFPDDGNLWDSLGEGYLKTKQKEQALISFKTALRLAPDENCHWCANAREKIGNLSSD
jgi:CubicO group peptidase (beta-lactamase class C family)